VHLDDVGHSVGAGDGADVVELILGAHHRILLMQQALHDAGRLRGEAGSAGALAAVWDRLADVIEVQAAAEEEICYQPMVAASSWSREQMEDAVADLADIGEAVAEARLQPVSSQSWWRAVKAAFSACVKHFDRQEEGVLADFRSRADRSVRRQLGGQWSAFITARICDLARGGEADDAACQLCQWPLPASHRHVLDTKACAVLCACHCCYELHRWAAHDELSGA
jgi:hypothetical protein